MAEAGRTRPDVVASPVGGDPAGEWPKPFETPPAYQAQFDFARFVTTFTDEPGIARIVWLFSLVLGHARAARRR